MTIETHGKAHTNMTPSQATYMQPAERLLKGYVKESGIDPATAPIKELLITFYELPAERSAERTASPINATHKIGATIRLNSKHFSSLGISTVGEFFTNIIKDKVYYISKADCKERLRKFNLSDKFEDVLIISEEQAKNAINNANNGLYTASSQDDAIIISDNERNRLNSVIKKQQEQLIIRDATIKELTASLEAARVPITVKKGASKASTKTVKSKGQFNKSRGKSK